MLYCFHILDYCNIVKIQ